jgi:hypothetical protein
MSQIAQLDFEVKQAIVTQRNCNREQVKIGLAQQAQPISNYQVAEHEPNHQNTTDSDKQP